MNVKGVTGSNHAESSQAVQRSVTNHDSFQLAQSPKCQRPLTLSKQRIKELKLKAKTNSTETTDEEERKKRKHQSASDEELNESATIETPNTSQDSYSLIPELL